MFGNRLDAAAKHFEKGSRLFKRQRYKAAIVQLKKAVALDPPWEDAHALLGIALEYVGETEQSVSAFRAGFQRGIRRDMLEHGVLGFFVFSLLKCGCYTEALDTVEGWEKAGLETIPPERAGLKGLCLSELERYDEALIAFKKAVEDAPEEMLWWYKLALMAAQCGDAATLQGVHVKLRVMLSRASDQTEAEEIRETIEDAERLMRKSGLFPSSPDDQPQPS